MQTIDALRVTHSNGVRVRHDNGGDEWANEHRLELGNQFYLEDLDGFIGSFGFARNGQDTLFAEYQPDGYENRMKDIREFALVAMFDRKQTYRAAFGDGSKLTRAFYLSQCRRNAKCQPIAPKFFYVVGTESPWQMYELNIDNAEVSHQFQLERGNWHEIWKIAGLIDARRSLEIWLKNASAPAQTAAQ